MALQHTMSRDNNCDSGIEGGACLLALPNEVLELAVQWLAPTDILQLRRSCRRLAYSSERHFAKIFQSLHVVLHPTSMRRLKEISESGYATRVKRLMISTHLLQDRTFRPRLEEELQHRDLCKEERQAIGKIDYVYSQVHDILKHCLPSIEVIVIADYEDTWTYAKTGFITGGPMGRKEILLRTGVDIVETHTLQPSKILEHWTERRSILAQAATAAADFAQSCQRTIHIDIAFDHVGSPQYGSSSSMTEARVSSDLYQLLSTDRIRHLSQRHTQIWSDYDDFELVGLPSPKMMTYTNWNYSSALRFYGDHQMPNLQQLNLHKVKAINRHLMDLIESSPTLHRLECVEVDLDNAGNFPPSAHPWRFVWETLNRHATLQELSFSRLGVMGFSDMLIENAGNDDASTSCLWSGQAEIKTGLRCLIEGYYYLLSLDMVNINLSTANDFVKLVRSSEEGS